MLDTESDAFCLDGCIIIVAQQQQQQQHVSDHNAWSLSSLIDIIDGIGHRPKKHTKIF
jgi:hypothetical protein